MADTIKSSNELKLVHNFADNDTRTMTLLNPRADLTATDIKDFATVVSATQAIIGDKGGARHIGIGSAKILEKQTTYLDLTNI